MTDAEHIARLKEQIVVLNKMFKDHIAAREKAEAEIAKHKEKETGWLRRLIRSKETL